VLLCRRLIAEVYNRDYEVVFSEDHYDLEAKIEPWPHRFLMALHDDVSFVIVRAQASTSESAPAVGFARAQTTQRA
jgi:hypothetical protein